MNLTPTERRFIRHALGLDRSLVAQRNHFSATGNDIVTGDALAARKLARRTPQPETVKTVGFAITMKGFEAACERGETLDPGVFNLMQWREVMS